MLVKIRTINKSPSISPGMYTRQKYHITSLTIKYQEVTNRIIKFKGYFTNEIIIQNNKLNKTTVYIFILSKIYNKSNRKLDLIKNIKNIFPIFNFRIITKVVVEGFIGVN